MKKSALIGLLGLCLWSTTLQSCNKDNPSPNGCNDNDSTYVDSTGNGDYNGPTFGDSTEWNDNGGNPIDSTDWNDNGGSSDSTDWNGGNPGDSLPG